MIIFLKKKFIENKNIELSEKEISNIYFLTDF
jgi:hypothetical protein